MKKKLILMLLITLTLSFSSCGSKTPSEETEGVVETTVASESEATATPEAASKESVVYTPDPTPTATPTPTPTADESTVTAEEVTPYASIEDIPKDIYDPASTEPMENRYQKVEDAYTSGKITESQYRDLVLKILNGDGNSTSSSTTGSTGSSTSGDTYIPAHGNPGTPMSNEDTGYEGRIEDAPDVSNSRLD